MAKSKKKNNNYQTEKRLTEKLQRESAARAEKKKKLILRIVISAVSVILVAATIIGIIGFNKAWFGFKATHKATIIVKDYGTIELELYGKEAPITVDNFVKLAEEGFYDGLTFHRIIEGFMAQGGDPDGDGIGGSDTTIKGEFSANGIRNRIKHERGVISMARNGNSYDSASSQFFIMHGDDSNLDGKYAAFGRVISGIGVVDKLCNGKKIDKTLDKSDQPIILSITVEKL